MSSSYRYAGDDVWNEVAALRRELSKANGTIRDYQKQLEGAEERIAIQSAWIEYLQDKQRKQKDPSSSASCPEELKGTFDAFDVDVAEPRSISKVDNAASSPENAATDLATPKESEPSQQSDSPTVSSVGERILQRSNEHYYCFGLPQDYSPSKEPTDHGTSSTKSSESNICFPRRQKSRYSGEDNDTSVYAEESSVSSWEGNHHDRQELLPCRVPLSSMDTDTRTKRRTKRAESLRLLLCIAPGSEATTT